jgi:hypothetical protein
MPADQLGLDQMKMIGQEAIGVDLPTGFGAGFRQCGEESLAVRFIQKDRLPAIATAHDMVHGAGILQTQFAGHTASMVAALPIVKSKC